MLLKLENSKILADAVAIISELVSEVRIKVDSSGLGIIAIDPANVALVSFKIPSSSFSVFEVTNEVLGVSLDSLKSVLRRCNAGSSLILKTEDTTLVIEIYDKIKRVFNLALINVDSEEKTMPALEFSCKVEMNGTDFSQAIEDCAIVSDSCSFIIMDNKFIVEARGLNSARSEFSDEVQVQGELGKSRYSLEYLNKFIKACKLSSKIRINFANDYPLKLNFRENHFELDFVLAPRVETED